MAVKIPSVSKRRRDEVFAVTQEVLRAIILGDKKAIKKAIKKWERILEY